MHTPRSMSPLPPQPQRAEQPPSLVWTRPSPSLPSASPHTTTPHRTPRRSARSPPQTTATGTSSPRPSHARTHAQRRSVSGPEKKTRKQENNNAKSGFRPATARKKQGQRQLKVRDREVKNAETKEGKEKPNHSCDSPAPRRACPSRGGTETGVQPWAERVLPASMIVVSSSSSGRSRSSYCCPSSELVYACSPPSQADQTNSRKEREGKRSRSRCAKTDTPPALDCTLMPDGRAVNAQPVASVSI
ncbi:uncharacterized protein K452DRAFT_125895 [Aplosporella prunicola CBS 121167]|uniref:Uncharacterized protein n=1 Tax=Aplosporella prunicola CBS 121167 TaxID=1176127 RepID=A0A6A6BNZ3_9PEZI|nr:uncharacterized protein K452DRAFT_125895 [Aplosporella prunicola CBS 121167]KAF2145812.1 hypothetical protein K452DRAFT_125895 [Aplosporella prunicola CBS 121167]